MDNYFDKALHYLGRTQSDQRVFVMNIGSMDGVMFDEMYGYTAMYGFRGLYVEPIPYLFEKLKKNIGEGSGNEFENSAISDYDGEIEMLMIDKEAIDTGKIHSCFYGMSAVYPPKNGLGSEGDRETVKRYGKRIKVPCIRFETLIEKHQIGQIDVIKIDAEGHDYKIFKQIDLVKYAPKVVRFEWINLSREDQDATVQILKQNNYLYEIETQDITALSKSFYEELKKDFDKKTAKEKNGTSSANPNISTELDKLVPKETLRLAPAKKAIVVTFVTGLWNIGREKLDEGWSRKYENYLDAFAKLLPIETNMIIFGDSELETFVWARRSVHNTMFIHRELSWFKTNDYYDKIQNIRTKPEWHQQAAWLENSTQAKLPMYNPLVMSKMFLLNDAQIMDKFNSDYMYWIDAGLSFTVHPGYFTHDRVQNKITPHTPKFTFITFPYNAANEVHGFDYSKLCLYAGQKTDKVARGGFFGGPKKKISQMNGIYYNMLIDTLSKGYMGTEESIFTIILYRHPELANYIEIEENGLLCKFFEDLKNDQVKVHKIFTDDDPLSNKICRHILDIKTYLYILTYNFPQQVEALLESYAKSDRNFLDLPYKFLINNSTDLSTDPVYDLLCEKYQLIQIKKDNIGICGGRQFVAEHFDASDADYYIFLEDDMMLHDPETKSLCESGFKRWVPDLYEKTLYIMEKEGYDYLKLNFTEVYGANDVQWAWYNVPEHVLIKYFPNKLKKPTFGLDPNPPLTQFSCIKTHEDIKYIEGDIYYCNWPLWFNKEGNKKVFLDPKFDNPFEQTWMSLVFQKQKEKILKTAVLLMSPINHNRMHYYKAEERREN
jgi:FkbM family methyltransferase